jgi:hypothetical protein
MGKIKNTYCMYYDINGNLLSSSAEMLKLFPEGRPIHIGDTILSNGIRVSTVFLSLNHNIGNGRPLIFETMVFPGENSFSEIDMDRYSSKEEAIAGHKKMVEKYSTKIT